MDESKSNTFFDPPRKNFKHVTVSADNKINTTEFLESSESVVSLFDVLGSKAFLPVQKDMTGNIKKIRDRQLSHPAQSKTLQDLCDAELAEKKHTASNGLLWLVRGLEFTSNALRKNIDSSEELSASFTSAYDGTLKQHHNIIVKGIFTVAMKACPYRDSFYKKLGDDQEQVMAEMQQWLSALEKIVAILKADLATANVK